MQIRKMTAGDRQPVLDMMQTFYASEAVWTDGSPEIFREDVEQCVGGSPYLEGYILEENGELLGYAMCAKSFSTEFGKPCLWIEDLYLKEEYRGQGLGVRFLEYIRECYPNHLHRLEVEEDNVRALRAYEKSGFSQLPYVEMFR